MSNYVRSCLNVLKLNYIDSKKSAISWNKNIKNAETELLLFCSWSSIQIHNFSKDEMKTP